MYLSIRNQSPNPWLPTADTKFNPNKGTAFSKDDLFYKTQQFNKNYGELGKNRKISYDENASAQDLDFGATQTAVGIVPLGLPQYRKQVQGKDQSATRITFNYLRKRRGKTLAGKPTDIPDKLITFAEYASNRDAFNQEFNKRALLRRVPITLIRGGKISTFFSAEKMWSEWLRIRNDKSELSRYEFNPEELRLKPTAKLTKEGAAKLKNVPRAPVDTKDRVLRKALDAQMNKMEQAKEAIVKAEKKKKDLEIKQALDTAADLSKRTGRIMKQRLDALEDWTPEEKARAELNIRKALDLPSPMSGVKLESEERIDEAVQFAIENTAIQMKAEEIEIDKIAEEKVARMETVQDEDDDDDGGADIEFDIADSKPVAASVSPSATVTQATPSPVTLTQATPAPSIESKIRESKNPENYQRQNVKATTSDRGPALQDAVPSKPAPKKNRVPDNNFKFKGTNQMVPTNPNKTNVATKVYDIREPRKPAKALSDTIAKAKIDRAAAAEEIRKSARVAALQKRRKEREEARLAKLKRSDVKALKAAKETMAGHKSQKKSTKRHDIPKKSSGTPKKRKGKK